MNLPQDMRILIAVIAFNAAMLLGLIFRIRLCAVIVMPLPIAGLFLALPQEWWWVPIAGAMVWLLLLLTVRLRGIFIPKDKMLSTKLSLLLAAFPGLPFAASAFLFYYKTNFIIAAYIALALPIITPVVVWNVFLFALAPLLTKSVTSCQSARAGCADQLEKSGRGWRTVHYVHFVGDPLMYRVSWLFYRKISRAAWRSYTYEKHECPLGIAWIKNVKAW